NPPVDLSPQDLTMNVAMPEIDGRILTRAVSFKAQAGAGEATTYRPLADRVAFVARQAKAWVSLGGTPAPQRRIALVMGNYPDRDGRIGNGVGLDTPASTAAIVRAMREAGYDVGATPDNASAVTDLFLTGRSPGAALPLADYAAFF